MGRLIINWGRPVSKIKCRICNIPIGDTYKTYQKFNTNYGMCRLFKEIDNYRTYKEKTNISVFEFRNTIYGEFDGDEPLCEGFKIYCKKCINHIGYKADLYGYIILENRCIIRL